MAPKELNFITGNANKLREVRDILGDCVELKNRSVDLPEIQGTIEEVSKAKCRAAADEVSGSGSCVKSRAAISSFLSIHRSNTGERLLIFGSRSKVLSLLKIPL